MPRVARLVAMTDENYKPATVPALAAASAVPTLRASLERAAKVHKNPDPLMNAVPMLTRLLAQAGVDAIPAGSAYSMASLNRHFDAAGISRQDRITVKSLLARMGLLSEG